MHLTSVLASLLFSSLVSAQTDLSVQVNWYSDQGCSQYMTSTQLYYASVGGCINFGVPGAGSMNIANCYLPQCQCNFYTSSNCQGSYSIAYTPRGTGQGGDANCVRTAQTIWEPVSYMCQD
ncbi:hypothetical protein F5884DRAFT_854452 [Xylogone sp. PMI_703]|nr:hypothetical protein F5884DRAFT_854452 [Xylogone sp. PMI_703]